MCYITNTQNDEQNKQRNYAKFFAPNQNYYNQFAIPMNGKQQFVPEYQDDSNQQEESEEQLQYGQYFQQQQQHFVYLDSKPFNQYGFSSQGQVNENEIFNILGPINENSNEQSDDVEFNAAYESTFNQGFGNESESPYFYQQNEEDAYFQPTYKENNFSYEAPIYNSLPQQNDQINNFVPMSDNNQDLQIIPQQSINNSYAQNYEVVNNEYSSQAWPQQFQQDQFFEQQEQQQQLPERIEQAPQIPIMQSGNYDPEQQSNSGLKIECKNEIQSSEEEELYDDNEKNIKFEEEQDEFCEEGHEEQNEIIDKIRKSNKKNVVKNIMSAFKRFIQDIQSDPSQSSSNAVQNSSSSLSQSNNSVVQCSSKVSKISNLKQNNLAHENCNIDIAYERDNVLALYNGSKSKPDSIEEMGKKFKRYISSKQFNHYTIRLLVQHVNYGQIFQYFLQNHAQNWLNSSKVDEPYGHKIMIEFLLTAFEDINIIEKLKKHEKRKAVFQ